MKCSICNANIKTTFLNKIVGTWVKDSKGKLKAVCNQCQKKFKTKDELLKHV